MTCFYSDMQLSEILFMFENSYIKSHIRSEVERVLFKKSYLTKKINLAKILQHMENI